MAGFSACCMSQLGLRLEILAELGAVCLQCAHSRRSPSRSIEMYDRPVTIINQLVDVNSNNQRSLQIECLKSFQSLHSALLINRDELRNNRK